MRQSDYAVLRQMLGYEPVELEADEYYLHSIPALEEGFETAMPSIDSITVDGQQFAYGGVFVEPFNQNDAYGNGFEYIVVVPDNATVGLPILYSLYAAVTQTPLVGADIQNLPQQYDGLAVLDRSAKISSSTYANGSGTSLFRTDVDYISGRGATHKEQATLNSLLLCLFYFAFILVIIGAAILATQVLSNHGKRRGQNNILHQLGMSERQIAKNGNRQLLLLFVLPIIPAVAISIGLIIAAANSMQLGAYSFPIFSDNLWIGQTVGISMLFFALLYGTYYLAARIGYRKQT